MNTRIEEARNNNQKSVTLGVFEPLVQPWLKLETVTLPNGRKQQQGFLENVLGAFLSPIEGVNGIFLLIGLPLFKNASGRCSGSTAQYCDRGPPGQDRGSGTAEGELAAKILEQVLLQVIDFDQTWREFQVSQEVAGVLDDNATGGRLCASN